MKAYFSLLFLGLLFFSSCTKQESKNQLSFYHWKSKAEFLPAYQQALEKTQSNKIYLHYFDIEVVKEPNYNSDGIFPTYVLKEVDEAYKGFEIVPVIYISNRVLLSEKLGIRNLSEKITKLVHQISEQHFGKAIKKIQMDCDWTASTRDAYFNLLRLLEDEFEINATIRLHQIKFQKKTGVPPVKSGTLMLYNVGDLKNKDENSILESEMVGQYINENTDYPIKLNLGLPLFSQTVIYSKKGQIKLIRNSEREVMENDPHFTKINESNFELAKDTLYKGFYLSKGYQLKLEELKESEIIAAYQLLQSTKLNMGEVIFYHLDEASLKSINLQEILDQI